MEKNEQNHHLTVDLLSSSTLRKSSLSESAILLPSGSSQSISIIETNNKDSGDDGDPHHRHHHHHHHHSNNLNYQNFFNHHLKIPTLSVTNVHNSEHDHSHRKFNFGFRRHSHTALNRVESMGSLGHRTIVQYIDSNDLPGLKTFLDTRHVQVDDRDENGGTALMVAAAKGLTSFVRELILRGADVKAEDFDNWSALLCAAKGGHLESVEIILGHGADIDHREMGGWTALMWASYRGHTSVVALLLEKNADVHAHGNYHLGPLLWASGRGHIEIVQLLVSRGAKVNVGDKYGTTALVWACRKGYADIVDILVKANANVDAAGMYSWTPLLVAVEGGHHDCVSILLEHKPNVNAIDKDGMTALALACREGYQEIASALIAAGAYINIQDRASDTPLIHAVKNGHRGVCEILLKRHADVDTQGKERKTALYVAVEKGHSTIVKLILYANPDLEAPTKDGDTALLRAVRNRNLEIVQILLERRAKVSAADRKGDTCLHIAMRARSKAIVEALLRNPKNSQLLYRANKQGETPYGIDANHQKTILGQVFGARRLNTNEDSEGMLGYELYSSALADVLSEPTLTTPITVGLFAKWGSGKSFLLTNLREEMKSFAHQWAEPAIKASWILLCVCLHLALIIGVAVWLGTWSFIWGITASVLLIMIVYLIVFSLKFASRNYDFYWAYSIRHGIYKRLSKLRLIMQVAFCHPPGPQCESQAMPVRFHFAEASAAPPTGEGAVGYMLAGLFEAIEDHYGSLPTRLYRAFRPKPLKSSSNWRFRKMCCIPLVVLFELAIVATTIGISLLIIIFNYPDTGNQEAILLLLYVVGGFLLAGILANLHSWARAFSSLFFSQARHLKRSMKRHEGVILTALGAEVALMTDMVKCLDAFTKQQSRLVGVVDALDSCDTERTLVLLRGLQMLLSTPNQPFVLLLAVDPHVIAKAAEAHSRRLFTEGGIGGHDFLRNLVHLPVYLQNSGLRKVQRAQNTALAYRRNAFDNQMDEPGLGHSASARRLSNASELMSSQEKLRAPHAASRPGSKKLRLSESVASSIGSNLHRLGQNPQGVLDLTKILLTDDYFSDVNPKSIRRLMNVIYITVRLLKAFQIDFSWYRLSSWINLTEQWPLRASMIVLEHDQSGDSMDDSTSLQSVYDKVRPKIACLREAASLVELDRDERKLDAFLHLHKSDMLVSDLRIFLPFTINLDPYLRKVLKEDQQAMEDEGILIPTTYVPPTRPQQHTIQSSQKNTPQLPMYQNPYNFQSQNIPGMMNYFELGHHHPGHELNIVARRKPNDHNLPPHMSQHMPHMHMENVNYQSGANKASDEFSNSFPKDVLQIKLSNLSVDGVIKLLYKIDDLKMTIDKIIPILQQNSISGRVLKYCDLTELKSVLGLSFGHWELFKLLIQTLRKVETQYISATSLNEISIDTNDSGITQQSQSQIVPIPSVPRSKSQSVIEKQVTLEEQMICGTLQTLNEEAFEDVAGSERPSPSGITSDGNSVLFQNAQTGYYSASTSTANSPTLIRRDSILKQPSTTGGAPKEKSDKRVSIKQDNVSNARVEIICERDPPNRNSGSRPVSLILNRSDHPHSYKLVRSMSFDEDNAEPGDLTLQKPMVAEEMPIYLKKK